MNLLQREDVRLVTLTGVGGTGKTRVALQSAYDTLDVYEHGVWFIDLAPIRDPHLVASTIAMTFGIVESAGTELQESLMTYLSSRQLLLILDNFEQVIEAALLVGGFARKARRV